MAGNITRLRQIELINSDHDKLNGALSAVSKNITIIPAGTSELVPSLKALIDRMSAHFRREEALMKSVHYKALRNHRQQHAILERGFKDILQEIEAGDFGEGTQALYRIFEDGLDKHTAQSDSLFFIAEETRLSAQASHQTPSSIEMT